MPEPFHKAIVVGDACVDVHLRLEDIVANDKKELPYLASLGGTIAGCAVALRKLAVPTAFLGTIGDDQAGRFIVRAFKDLDIDPSLTIVRKELNTVNVFAFIDSEGERHLWGYPREDQAYADLDPDQIDLDKIKTASWLHSSGMTLLSKGSIQKTLPELFRIAYEAGVKTSFDLNTRVSDLALLDPEGVEAIRKTLPYVRYLTGSAKDEFVSFHPCDDWKNSVRHFANGDRTVIARLGKEGYLLIGEGKEKEYPSYEIETINTTGAGDCFNAGFIAASLEGRNIEEACAFGNAVAAYKISHEADTYYDRDTIRRFMAETALRNEGERI